MTRFRTVSIDGLDIFYREAGSRSNPTILLLHGFPTSSHMFRNLIPALADRFHLLPSRQKNNYWRTDPEVIPLFPQLGNQSSINPYLFSANYLAREQM